MGGLNGLSSIISKVAKSITSLFFIHGRMNKIPNFLTRFSKRRNRIQKYIAIEHLFVKVFKGDRFSS